MMEQWAMEEFGGARLGDGRLTKRLIKLATRYADKPTASIPGACGDWAETQAVYRFFEQGIKGDRPRLYSRLSRVSLRAEAQPPQWQALPRKTMGTGLAK